MAVYIYIYIGSSIIHASGRIKDARKNFLHQLAEAIFNWIFIHRYSFIRSCDLRRIAVRETEVSRHHAWWEGAHQNPWIITVCSMVPRVLRGAIGEGGV